MPNGINTGTKYLNFRPFDAYQLWKDETSKVARHADKGYYYRFNCQNEIKLIKFTLEDNGFLPQPFVKKTMSTTYQQIHQGDSKHMKVMGEDWLLMWSTKMVKLNQFNLLKKQQKINQFPKSYELTRKDLLAERIMKMAEIHHGPN